MKRVLLITTGGTIASVPSEEGLTPGMAPAQLTNSLPLKDLAVDLETFPIFSLDSSNMQPQHWQALARAVFSQRDNYDCVVISHGTDTMSYTAAALSLMLPNIDIPVILTGSMLPMDQPGSDGPENLRSAVAVAATGHPGVMIVFNGIIIKGARASKVSTKDFAAFASINYPPLGNVENGRVTFSQPPFLPQGSPQLAPELEPQVMVLKLIPGLTPNLVTALPGLGFKGLVIEAFGTGGLPFVEEGNLLPALEQVLGAGIPVVVGTQSLAGGVNLANYQVGQKAAALGVIPGQDMTTEATVVKLMWVLAQTTEPQRVREMMAHNYCGELGEVQGHPEKLGTFSPFTPSNGGKGKRGK